MQLYLEGCHLLPQHNSFSSLLLQLADLLKQLGILLLQAADRLLLLQQLQAQVLCHLCSAAGDADTTLQQLQPHIRG